MLFFIITILFANLSIDAQSYKIYGHVYFHDKSQPLSYASVKNCNTQQVVLSDSVGYFEIQVNKNDSLTCSYIGYADKVASISDEKTIDFCLDNNVQNLNEVEVIGRRKAIQMSHGGFIINMDVINKNGKLFSDILPQIPLINIKGGIISMVGKNEVLVFLNNHQLYLKGDELIAYLNSLGAENIQKIQVLSTPPAKYEANENIGILKIETLKKINPGLQANLLGKGSIAHYLSYGTSAKILYSSKKFSVETAVLGSCEKLFTHSQYSNMFKNYIVSTNCPKKSEENFAGILTNLNLILGQHDNISTMLQLPLLSKINNRDIANDTKYFSINNIQEDSIMSSKGYGKSANYQTNLEINYAHSFNDKSNLNITLGYINSYERNHRNWLSLTKTALTTLDENFCSAGHQKNDIYTFKMDFDNSFKNWKFSEGYKFSYINTKSYNEEDEKLVYSTSHNLFGYREANNALYVNAESSIKSIQLSLGLRAEYTYTKGLSYTLNTINNNHYLRVFPVVGIEYLINNSNTISIDYSGRIKRPNFQLLDPFRWYTSKYDYSEGNPFMKPSYIHNVSLSYMCNNSFYTKMYFTKTNKDFGKMVFLDSENIQNQVERAGNFFDISTFGINVEYNFQLGSWLETNLTGDITYSSYISNQTSFKNVKGWGSDFSLNNSFFLSKRLTGFLYIEDDIPGYYNYRKAKNAFLLNLGLSYTNKNKTMIVSIKAEDLFKTSNPKYSYYSNGIKQKFNNYYDSQHLEITLIKKIGNVFNKAKPTFQSSNSEERNRL